MSKFISLQLFFFAGRVTCDGCGKLFKNKKVLQSHRSLDCGRLKDYACYLCNFKSKRKAGLKKHILLKHNQVLLPK